MQPLLAAAIEFLDAEVHGIQRVAVVEQPNQVEVFAPAQLAQQDASGGADEGDCIGNEPPSEVVSECFAQGDDLEDEVHTIHVD